MEPKICEPIDAGACVSSYLCAMLIFRALFRARSNLLRIFKMTKKGWWLYCLFTRAVMLGDKNEHMPDVENYVACQNPLLPQRPAKVLSPDFGQPHATTMTNTPTTRPMQQRRQRGHRQLWWSSRHLRVCVALMWLYDSKI